MSASERQKEFSGRLWQWFDRHRRTLPWRDVRNVDEEQRAYMILVSEIMLQQTQVARVEKIFQAFLKTFPTLQDLSQATNKEVLIAWKGMGYNSRALRLRDAAKTLLNMSRAADQSLPTDEHVLRSIKGIGPYTAAAMRNFAFDIPTPCVDTNIRRILHRVFVGPERKDGTLRVSEKVVLHLAGNVLRMAMDGQESMTRKQARGAADWHGALMDFGSLVCTKSSPRCAACPMAEGGLCRGAFHIKKERKKKRTEPGRMVGKIFIPNRIFRGRIIDALRHCHDGMTISQLGKKITPDWSAVLKEWLEALLKKMRKEELIEQRAGKYVLKS